jgi:hypothetical protein
MGQFKPMVKMMTDEPSVILKLKKGGHVASKKDAKAEHGHKPMSGLETRPTSDFMGAEDGDAPKKPSMADRRKAMNPNLYKKGGKTTAVEVEVDLKRHASKPASVAHDGLKKGGKVQKKADGGRIDEFVKGKVCRRIATIRPREPAMLAWASRAVTSAAARSTRRPTAARLRAMLTSS